MDKNTIKKPKRTVESVQEVIQHLRVHGNTKTITEALTLVSDDAYSIIAQFILTLDKDKK